MTKNELGYSRLQDILGDKAETIMETFKEISPDFANYIVEYAYGDLYARKGISDKHRELSAVACMIGQGNTGVPIKAHLNGMLNVGWTKEEIIETLIFLSGYAGFPSCVDAILQLKEIIKERSEPA